mmetsp:Transcript_38504/g.121329  ORF Transcript_38504/g.121329 Transcript_38504/m.121329 type:complete len:296 (-) Transcript_38504:914-1801(-)
MGSSYNGAIRPRREEKTMSCRAMTWMHENSKLQQAPSALVVGAGLVGVELAAEIIAVYPSKRVTLVYGTQDVCKELPPPARAYIRTWLKERGVIIKSDRRVSDFRGDECVLDDGQTLQAPLIYRCLGSYPRSDPLQEEFEDKLDSRGAIRVNSFLQVIGCSNVYAAGDVTVHAQHTEEKTGYTAEQNAKLAASNIVRDIEGKELLSYPDGLFGEGQATPTIFCVSLSKYDGVVIFNSLILTGKIAAVFKWLIEWTKVASMRGRPVGKLFWQVADVASIFLSNYIFRPKKDSKSLA